MTLSITPLSPALGAEVSAPDLRKLSAADAAALHEAWLNYHVLVVRNGTVLGDDDLVAFGQCFGHVEKARKMSPLASRPEIMVISNIRENGETIGSLPDGELAWHYDRMHQKIPNKAGVLHAIETPARGGETRFANMCLAYETLPLPTRERIETLMALNTYEYGSTTAQAKQLSESTPSAVHPIVRRLPETGQKALYVCRLMTDRIMELPDDSSQELLTELCDHAEQQQFVIEHHWTPGDVLIWDNRCVIHSRNDFDAGERRLLKRVAVGDDVPPQH
ncbi:MAG: TauD/TfdA family dioxygenase [Pseudomonadota bacterium]|nr:TauD/TfdA family dioxygenase [Pseudomonadota bacterium]